MTPYDAQTALDAIHQRQAQTRDEYARHASTSYGLTAALTVFATGSSIDLPRPWSLLAQLAGGVLIAAGLAVQYRRTRVHQKRSAAGTLFAVSVVAVALTVFIAASILARLLDLPVPSVPAAAVAALATLVATYTTRPIVMKILSRGGEQADGPGLR
ncbi:MULTISPECIES: hypothetical protein [unclassified Streptomyces]|uniref:hypothetical protein n=1 Tax=unclassified Streptomyces TaxID=2593676 RepID=UPI00037016CC|nr:MULTISPECIES: hypothetical protein [unclassified Streptomyces]MYT28127.1 hypothetical protein [Streptomyces sp. SID8354]